MSNGLVWTSSPADMTDVSGTFVSGLDDFELDCLRRPRRSITNGSPLLRAFIGCRRVEAKASRSNSISEVFVMLVLDRPAIPPVVLVAEDDMILRMRAVDLVDDAGYVSVAAMDADEALAVFSRGPVSRSCLQTSRCRAAWMGFNWPMPFTHVGRSSRLSLCREN
jgi:hypothetical protein